MGGLEQASEVGRDLGTVGRVDELAIGTGGNPVSHLFSQKTQYAQVDSSTVNGKRPVPTTLAKLKP